MYQVRIMTSMFQSWPKKKIPEFYALVSGTLICLYTVKYTSCTWNRRYYGMSVESLWRKRSRTRRTKFEPSTGVSRIWAAKKLGLEKKSGGWGRVSHYFQEFFIHSQLLLSFKGAIVKVRTAAEVKKKSLKSAQFCFPLSRPIIISCANSLKKPCILKKKCGFFSILWQKRLLFCWAT